MLKNAFNYKVLSKVVINTKISIENGIWQLFSTILYGHRSMRQIDLIFIDKHINNTWLFPKNFLFNEEQILTKRPHMKPFLFTYPIQKSKNKPFLLKGFLFRIDDDLMHQKMMKNDHKKRNINKPTN